jgi:phospholipid/cholesterol/gamma-HCH transport system substrate-binding protein
VATKIELKNGDKITQTQDAVVLEKMISQFLYNKASETTEAAPAAKASTEVEEDALTANPLDAMTKP